MTLSNGDYLGTNEAAKLCQIACRTMTKLFDAGKVEGFRLPGTSSNRPGPRRISKISLAQLLLENGMPLNGLLDNMPRKEKVLLVLAPEGLDQVWLNTDMDGSLLGWDRRVGNTFLWLGMELERLKPESLLLDFACGRKDCLDTAWSLAGDARFADMSVLGLINDDDPDGEELCSIGFDKILRKPLNPQELSRYLTENEARSKA